MGAVNQLSKDEYEKTLQRYMDDHPGTTAEQAHDATTVTQMNNGESVTFG